MKKIIIFLSVVIVLFVAVGFLTKMQTEQKVEENNLYNKDDLKPETIDLLDDPNYQNIILPDELEEKLANKEDVTVYFFSPTCPHCLQTTPIVAPMAEEMGIDLVLYNLLEFEEGWDKYNIKSTPTMIQFKGGEEEARIVGYNEEEIFKEWFETNSK